ncbi:MAG: type II secretion system F family protein [Candidatus Scalinduaceae bacterium]
MPIFKYEAVDSKGLLIKDRVEAESSEEAIDKIHSDGFYPTRVKQLKERKERYKSKTGEKTKRKGTLTSITIGKINAKEINSFTRQLSTLQDAGIPIVQSLTILEAQAKKGIFKKILGDMITDIQGGDSLTVAMSKHPKAFDKLYINVVNAGEIGGALDVVLRRLATYREKIQKLKRKIISSMTYPVAVIVIACAILTGIIMFIIPKFAKMFEEMDISLPMITLSLVRISNFMITYWYLLFGIPFALFVLYKLIGKIEMCRLVIDKLKFKIPIFGNIINKSVISKFTRTLATLISSGVPILEALNNVKGITGNLAMTRATENIHDNIREGESIAKPLRESKICESMVVNMVEIGEQSGELEKMLTKVADNYDNEIDTAVESMISLIEPIMIVFLGGSVGAIVVALFMPLVKLMGSIG